LFIATKSEATPKTTSTLIGTHTAKLEEVALTFDVEIGEVNCAVFLVTSRPNFFAEKSRSTIANAEVEGDS